MRVIRDIIAAKRDGKAHSKEEIECLINAICSEEISQAQLSAWLMAVYLQGMTSVEIAQLTEAMAHSGEVLTLSDQLSADKHSTGGVGDKTSLILVPLLASCGLKMAKLSGKALGHTGGTLDKLSCFRGIRLDLSTSDMAKQLAAVGCFISGQTNQMVPADKRMYALRNQTATVGSIPLIASSIMSKKIAGGAHHIVLDVKVGRGAIFESEDKARTLAKSMVDIGKKVGRPTRAILTDMSQPLGYAVGNLLEVQEALATLRGHGPADLVELCLALGHEMLHLAGRTETYQDSRRILLAKIESGEAMDKLREMITAQGGRFNLIDPGPDSEFQIPLAREQLATSSGFVTVIDARTIGSLAMTLMGESVETPDLTAGIQLHKKVGDQVQAGDALLTLHGSERSLNKIPESRVISSFTISDHEPPNRPLVIDVLE